MTTTVTAGELLRWARTQDPALKPAHARILLAHLTGQSADFLFTHSNYAVPSEAVRVFKEQAQDLMNGVPLSRITGEREFWSLPFLLNEDTLDPRPDSETLIESVLAYMPDRQAPLKILDLGTGTGCLLISLLTELPNATGVGVDISPKALEAAQENASRHLEEGRATFVLSHWFEKLTGTFDLIISNPPYIPRKDYENLAPEVLHQDPERALVAGDDGLDCYRDIIKNAPAFLKPGGALALEIGIHQTQAVSGLLTRHGFVLKNVCKDLSGIDRCLISSYDIADTL